MPLTPPSVLLEIVRQVVPLQVLALVVGARRAVRRVGARLQHEVHLHAGRRLPRVGAAGRDLHFLEHVEVVVARRRAERAHVGDRDAVHVPGVVAGRRPFRDVVGLLPGLRSADVDAIDDDAGDRLQDDPGIARARNVLQLLVGDVGRDRLPVRLEDRRVTRHLDLFADALHAERDAQRDDAAGADRHGAIQVVGESLERGLHLIRAGRQVQEVHLPLRVGDGGLILRTRRWRPSRRAARPRCCPAS